MSVTQAGVVKGQNIEQGASLAFPKICRNSRWLPKMQPTAAADWTKRIRKGACE